MKKSYRLIGTRYKYASSTTYYLELCFHWNIDAVDESFYNYYVDHPKNINQFPFIISSRLVKGNKLSSLTKSTSKNLFIYNRSYKGNMDEAVKKLTGPGKGSVIWTTNLIKIFRSEGSGKYLFDGDRVNVDQFKEIARRLESGEDNFYFSRHIYGPKYDYLSSSPYGREHLITNVTLDITEKYIDSNLLIHDPCNVFNSKFLELEEDASTVSSTNYIEFMG